MKAKIIYLISFIPFLILGSEKDPDVQTIDQTIDQKIERVAKKYIIHGRTPGIIAGTIKSGETNVYSYGVANLATGAGSHDHTINL